MKTVIVDYGMGNLRSVQKAIESLGFVADITSDPAALDLADKVILPGVGEFGTAMHELEERKLLQPVKDVIAAGKPVMGICLGMQLLLDGSEESPDAAGLGAIKGVCRKFMPAHKMPVPQMGWNNVCFEESRPDVVRMFDGIPQNSYYYFVHSYYADCENAAVAACTEYGHRYPSVLLKGNLFAAQFHPEKSQTNGLRLLKNFLTL